MEKYVSYKVHSLNNLGIVSDAGTPEQKMLSHTLEDDILSYELIMNLA